MCQGIVSPPPPPPPPLPPRATEAGPFATQITRFSPHQTIKAGGQGKTVPRHGKMRHNSLSLKGVSSSPPPRPRPRPRLPPSGMRAPLPPHTHIHIQENHTHINVNKLYIYDSRRYTSSIVKAISIFSFSPCLLPQSNQYIFHLSLHSAFPCSHLLMKYCKFINNLVKTNKPIAVYLFPCISLYYSSFPSFNLTPILARRE